nr:MAG TPA: hypothetical protein [Caudoviricetes sp.]
MDRNLSGECSAHKSAHCIKFVPLLMNLSEYSV